MLGGPGMRSLGGSPGSLSTYRYDIRPEYRWFFILPLVNDYWVQYDEVAPLLASFCYAFLVKNTVSEWYGIIWELLT